MSRLYVFLGLFILVIGGTLFHVKYRVVALEQELYIARQKITEINHAIHILKAEWEHLNQPQRLQLLAENHLDLKFFEKNQYLAMSSLVEKDSFLTIIEKAVETPTQKESLGKPILVQYVPMALK